MQNWSFFVGSVNKPLRNVDFSGENEAYFSL